MSNIADTIESKRLQDELILQLCSTLSGYLEQSQIDDCVRAYKFSADAHSGQFRKSGEAYICHPISVAIMLAEMRMDASGIMADGFIDAAGMVVCPLHRYRFSLQNGRNTSGEGYYLKTYPTQMKEDGLYVAF